MHGQSANNVSWQGQVRGNPAAEYAALMQARTAEEAGGGAAPTPAPFVGMQQMGINQAMDGRGFEPVAMATGYAPRGDPAAAYAAMLQAQTAPAQFPMTQMPLNVPAIGSGLQGMMMNPTAMNQGIY